MTQNPEAFVSNQLLAKLPIITSPPRIFASPDELRLPASCLFFFLRGGQAHVHLFTSNKCLGLVEDLAEFYPEASRQRWVVHFYRNV